MIRKAIIVVLTLGALGIGTLGVGSGFNRVIWHKQWQWGELQTTSHRHFWVGIGGGNRTLSLRYVRYLDGPTPPTSKGWYRFGWAYQDSVFTNQPTGLDLRARGLIVSFVIPLATAILLGIYPAHAAMRRPLRRRRRRRRGLCVTCGYDLKGNVTGTCPECGELA